MNIEVKLYDNVNISCCFTTTSSLLLLPRGGISNLDVNGPPDEVNPLFLFPSPLLLAAAHLTPLSFPLRTNQEALITRERVYYGSHTIGIHTIEGEDRSEIIFKIEGEEGFNKMIVIIQRGCVQERRFKRDVMAVVGFGKTPLNEMRIFADTHTQRQAELNNNNNKKEERSLIRPRLYKNKKKVKKNK
eukprot:gene7601-5362_t